MNNLSSEQIRERFLEFFKKREHEIIPSASLVPENDSSVLFNTAGMQPLTPYLLGQAHPKGQRLANIQKCVRTNDIEEIGDISHLTFFEMLGHWSLGDYFKEKELPMMYEFLTSKEEGLGLDPKRLYFTVFEGDKDVPKDTESFEILKKNVPKNRIYFLDANENWWQAGESGPCGPDSEYFYDVKGNLGDLSKEDFLKNCDEQNIIEICNSVFMEYEKKDGKIIGNLKNKNVDFGGGFERWTTILQEKESVYETDLFSEGIEILEKNSTKKYKDFKKDFRIILDHVRACVFFVSDGVLPSNKDAGYILRRLIRRTLVKMQNIEVENSAIENLIDFYIQKYQKYYPNVLEKKEKIHKEILNEIEKFEKTLEKGLKEFEKIVNPENTKNNIKKIDFGEIDADCLAQNELSPEDAFYLISSFGFPKEMIIEEAEKRGICVDEKELDRKIKEHGEKSATASAGKFKGGLGGDSPKITAFHTATHLLLAGLKKFAGENIHQAGSNITEERTRFDFTSDKKIEREILDKVEDYVNDAISKKAEMVVENMEKNKAKESGVEGSFWEKYPDVVKVWTIKDKDGNIYSRELCGGPHVKNTEEIEEFGKFKIKKEESSSAGVRRVKAIFSK